MTEKELWRPVIGYEDLYDVSNLGRIRSRFRMIKTKNRWGSMERPQPGRFLSPTNNTGGYLGVGLTRDGKTVRHLVHRLVAMAFIREPTDSEQVNHKDGDKKNNTLDNLEWVTASENQHHRSHVLGKNIGEDVHCAILNKRAVIDIRKRYTPYCKKDGQRALAKEFGVSSATIASVVNQRIWKTVSS